MVIPARKLGIGSNGALSQKFAVNCERRLFQRPDDAIHRGLDRQTEKDLARDDNFLSNFEPLTAAQARGLVEQMVEFDEFTAPMQQFLHKAAEGSEYLVCSANPRLIDGKPTKNPRYLQVRPDLVDPMPRYIAEQGARLARGLSPDEPLYQPVGAVLMGRRNNPPDLEAGIRPLAVYGPIHYQELPELFMDLICSLTGKSPSTTGAGSEGALTKGPFNALRPIVDLNNALVSYALTGLGGFSTAAGYVGPYRRVDHDISLLIPELWCRLSPRERHPQFLIEHGHLERVQDFDHDGRPVLASRLGYRITLKFVRTFLGRVFDHPSRVFDEAFLRPETQDLASFVDGVHNITEAQKRVATQYFEDGSIEDACPPLRVLLNIMAFDHYEGRDAHHPEVRAMFDPATIRASDWYRKRLVAQQKRDERLRSRQRDYLDAWLTGHPKARGELAVELQRRRQYLDEQLQKICSPEYVHGLDGMLGLDPSLM